MADLVTPYDILNDSDATTEYLDRVIMKSLQYEGIFDQFTTKLAIGRNDDAAPSSFQYKYIEKTGRNFGIVETRPGTLAEKTADIYAISIGEIKMYSGQIQTPYELKKVEVWEIAQDILNDMAQGAVDDYETMLGAYFTAQVTDVAEKSTGDFTWPDDIITIKKAVHDAHKREPDILLIATDLEYDIITLEQFLHADKYGSRDALLNGEIGRLLGLRVISTPLLNATNIDGTLPTAKTMMCLRMAATPWRVENWTPLFRYWNWYDYGRHVYINELRGFFDIRIYDATACRQMIFAP